MVYSAELGQAGTAAPSADIKANNLPIGVSLARDSLGIYTVDFSVPVPRGNVQLTTPSGTTYWNGAATLAIPISDEGTINGYLYIYGQTDDAGVTIKGFVIETRDAAFNSVEWNTILGRIPIVITMY